MSNQQRSFKERSRPLRSLFDESRSKPYGSVARKPKTYCICNGPSEGFMIECESCKDWFHAKCVNVEEAKIPKHFYCAPCVHETQESKDLEETIVEALSLLAEQAAFERIHANRPDLSDRDEESMEEGMPTLTSDDKENVPNGSYRSEVEPVVMKKRALGVYQARSSAFFDSDPIRFPSPFSPHYPSSPLSDHSGSEDSCPSVESPSSPSDSPAPARRHSGHPVTKTYTRKNKKQIGVLERFYEENPSPDPNMVHMIALESGLPDQKVSRWFYDKRRRSKQLGHAI